MISGYKETEIHKSKEIKFHLAFGVPKYLEFDTTTTCRIYNEQYNFENINVYKKGKYKFTLIKDRDCILLDYEKRGYIQDDDMG